MWPFSQATEITSGNSINDIGSLGQYDGQFNEGDNGRLVLHFSVDMESVPGMAGTIDLIGQQLVNQGAFAVSSVTVSGSDVVVDYQIAAWPVWLVVATILAVLATVWFIGWTLFKVADATGGLSNVVIAALVVWGVWSLIRRTPQGTYGDRAFQKVTKL